jgi:methionyl-tRNA formyltransferase
MTPQVVFMGSPDFALPSLENLARYFQVVGVVTQPDRLAGRGRTLKPPAVKVLARKLGIPVTQPESLRTPAAMERLHQWRPDVIVVTAFGQILREDVLELPTHGCVNVHGSLLPRWRGAAPIQAAILYGDDITGVTIMKMDPGLDTGPILSQRSIPIEPQDTAGTLSPRLAKLGADLLVETLPPYLHGEISPQPQDDSRSTFAPMLNKTDGDLDFHQAATDLSRRVRAYNPWPGAYTHIEGVRLKIHRAHADASPSPGPGIRTIVDGFPAIGTAEGTLVLEEVQPAGRNALAGDAYLRGARNWSA